METLPGFPFQSRGERPSLARRVPAREGMETLPGFPFQSRGERPSLARRVPPREGMETLPGFPCQRSVAFANPAGGVWLGHQRESQGQGRDALSAGLELCPGDGSGVCRGFWPRNLSALEIHGRVWRRHGWTARRGQCHGVPRATRHDLLSGSARESRLLAIAQSFGTRREILRVTPLHPDCRIRGGYHLAHAATATLTSTPVTSEGPPPRLLPSSGSPTNSSPRAAQP
jgi:hypothetical protein